MKRKLLGVLLCFVVAVSVLSGCKVVDMNAAMTVEGVDVTVGEFNFILDSHKQMLAMELGFDVNDQEKWNSPNTNIGGNHKPIDVAKDNAINDIVSVWVQAKKAQDMGIVLNAEQLKLVEENYSNMVVSYGGTSAFEKKCSEWKVSKETVKEIIKKYIYANALMEKQFETNTTINSVTDEEILAQYNMYFENYITAKHILIQYDNPAENITRTKEEARALAQSILNKIRAGEDFDALAKVHTDDNPDAIEKGYTFIKDDGTMVPAFNDAAAALEVGQVSELVEVEQPGYYNGFHIIKRVELDPVYAPSLETLSPDIKKVIMQERYYKLVNEDWVKNAKVDEHEKVLDKLN